MLAPGMCYAAKVDETVREARLAYEKKDAFALAEAIQRLRTHDHVLAPYAEYWWMLMHLDSATLEEVNDFLVRHATLPFTDKLRGEWLKKRAKANDWPTFLEGFAQFQGQDTSLACYAAQATAAIYGNETLAYAKALWMQVKEHPANCNALFDQMQASGMLTDDDILSRYRMVLAENRLPLAKDILKRAKGIDAEYLNKLDMANANPMLLITKQPINAKSAYGRELYLYALHRIAKKNSAQALSAFKTMYSILTPEDKAYFYALLGHVAAMRHETQALEWFKLTNNSSLTNVQHEWYVRSALRQEDWKAVLTAIEAMPPEQAIEATWRYWKARALKAQGQPAEANGLLAELSTERHFYGWLAQEELGPILGAQIELYTPSENDVNSFSKLLAVQRVEALQRLDYRWEAKVEWALATDGFDDQQLLVAAEFAARKKWYDLSVVTADKTSSVHNFSLRYPTPYRELIKPAAKQQGLDEAWVYAIARQESRFMHGAKSNVGAAGLMQVMPATARWIANKAGWRDYHHGMIHDIDTNISLGTYYMKYILEQFNGQEVMATAAYNAGPSRAKRWQGGGTLEGAIYVETIPFSETRNYVKKVLANAHMYAKQLGLAPVPLKQRLGMVPANLVATAEN